MTLFFYKWYAVSVWYLSEMIAIVSTVGGVLV